MIRRFFSLCVVLLMTALLASCEDPASVDPNDADDLSALRPRITSNHSDPIAVTSTSICVEITATDPNNEALSITIQTPPELGSATSSTSGCATPAAREDETSAPSLTGKLADAQSLTDDEPPASTTPAGASKTTQDDLVGSISYVVRQDVFNGQDGLTYLVSNASGYAIQGTIAYAINRAGAEAPDPPSLVTPANNATEITTTPTFSWSNVADADRYTLQVATTQDFSSGVLINRDVTGTSYTVSANEELNTGTTYFWRVRSISDDAGPGNFSAARSFATRATPPPPAPVLVTPADNATDVALMPTLIWQLVQSAESYDVQVALDTDVDFGTPVFAETNVPATAIVVSTSLSEGTTYRWRVRSFNTAGGSGPYSDPLRFTTRGGGGPVFPTVSITSPANGASFEEGQNIDITATASDADGTVSQVTFSANGNVISTDTDGSDGFSATLAAPSAGSYTLIAEATDNDGNAATSAPITVMVVGNTPPTISITSPSDGASFEAGQSINIAANATDADGNVTQVQFFVNDALLSTDITSNDGFTATLNNPDPGQYIIAATAIDDDGASTQATTVTVTVNPAGNELPSVSITSPADGASFEEGQDIAIAATATDTDGTIAQVEFLRQSNGNTQSLGVDTTAPYEATFGSPAPGAYTLIARATDDDGGTATDMVNVTVTDDSGNPPTEAPELRSPPNNTVVSLTTELDWSAVANATSYDVHIDTSEDNVDTENATFRRTVTTRSFDIPAGVLEEGQTYFWTVRGRNEAGAGPFAAPFEFTAEITPKVALTPTNGNFNQVRIGTTSTRDFTLRNSGEGVLTGSVSISGAQFSLASGGGNFLLTAGQTKTVQVSFSPTDATTFFGTLSVAHNGTNTATPLTLDLQGIGVVAPPQYDLAVTKVASATTVNQGDAVAFTVTLTNNGPAGGTNIEVTDALPAGLTFVSANATQGTYDNGSGAWSVGDLANGATATLTINATAQATATNTATITAGLAQEGDNATNNTAEATVTVNQAPTVSITSPADEAAFIEGDDVDITATAADADGTVTQVEFFEGANSLGVDNDGSDGFSVTFASPAVGDYVLTAVATDDGGATTTSDPVDISVAANQAPTVSITSPADEATFTEGDDVNITATASDADGTVTQVEFFEGVNSLGVDTEAPFEATFANVAVGDYVLTAVATDDRAATTTSAEIDISVTTGNTPPVATNDTAETDQDVAVVINVLINDTDSDGTIDPTTVNIEVGDDVTNGSTSINPVNGNVTYTPTGGFTGSDSFMYTVQDNEGATSNKATVDITVNVPNQAPSVSITSPTEGTVFMEGDDVNITATASDADGTVTQVEFFEGANSLGVDTTAPYEATLSSPAAGAYVLTAVATDDEAETTTSTAVNITVNAPPTVSITSPTEGAVIPDGDDVNITATASDTDGTVTQVEFFDGVTSLGTDTEAPYEATLSSPTAGAHALTAVATDDDGATTTSTAINITVNQAPTLDNPIADENLTAGGASLTVDLTTVFSDPDGDTLTFSAESTDDTIAVASIQGDTITLEVAPDAVNTGTVTITVTADDGTDTVQDTFDVTVN